MNTLTQTQLTPGQVKLITRIIGDVADSKPVQDALAKLDKEGAERLKGDLDFAESLRQHTIQRIAELSVSSHFANEEVESKYGYPSGYTRNVAGRLLYEALKEQCNRLRKFFPGLGYANLDLLAQIKKGDVQLPQHAERFFAFPNIWKTEALQLFGGSYGHAVYKVFNLIEQTREGKFNNYSEGHFGPKRLRQTAHVQKFWETFGNEQKDSDILVVPAQFGLRHLGRSVRRAREVMQENEFGLGAFAVGIMILTHPERLMNYGDISIDCAGDESDDSRDRVRFVCAPIIQFYCGGVEFCSRRFNSANSHCGSASAFVPQQ